MRVSSRLTFATQTSTRRTSSWQTSTRRTSLERTLAGRSSGANLSRADLSGAEFSGASVARTAFADVDLSVAKGLETVVHRGPSTIGIDTIYKSRGKIPEVFLRGCGVPDEFIAYIGSMVGRPSISAAASSATRPRTRSLPSVSMPTCKRKACAASSHRRK